jgi:uncharacterized protein (DUF1015 family)
MMTFVAMESPGLMILPTHRVIHGLASFDGARFAEQAGQWFDVQPITGLAPALLKQLQTAGPRAMVAATRVGSWRLQPKAAAEEELAEVSPRQRQLPLLALHRLLLERVLGISAEAVRQQKNIEYLRDAGEAVDRVQGGADVAFLLNSCSVEQVREISLAGETMPQKSTDFYPKLLSGLTIYALD